MKDLDETRDQDARERLGKIFDYSNDAGHGEDREDLQGAGGRSPVGKVSPEQRGQPDRAGSHLRLRLKTVDRWSRPEGHDRIVDRRSSPIVEDRINRWHRVT